MEGVYWTLDPSTTTQTVSGLAQGYNSPLEGSYTRLYGTLGGTPGWNTLGYTGSGGQYFFDGAQAHSLTRRDEFHDAEVNLVHYSIAHGCDCPWELNWLVGVPVLPL